MGFWTIDILKPSAVLAPVLDTLDDWQWVQAKRDGFRLTLYHDKHNQRYAFGREVRDDLEFLRRFPRVSKVVEKALSNTPPGTVVDGEIYAPGRPASDVPTALREDKFELKFGAFAIPVFDGSESHVTALNTVNRKLEQWGFDTVPTWKRGHPFFTAHPDYLSALSEVKDAEGFVFKRSNYFDWYKLKQEETVDAVIVGWKEGKGKYIGELGSLEVAVFEPELERDQREANWRNGKLTKDSWGEWERKRVKGLRTIANVSGMTDDERFDMGKLADDGKLIGRVIEVQYQYIGNGGKLRHPRFVRWREDKPFYEV